ncbi:MAG: hypothetical protein ACYTGL_25580 [Planctomycetota bacterium]|jgi:hypothetical protein
MNTATRFQNKAWGRRAREAYTRNLQPRHINAEAEQFSNGVRIARKVQRDNVRAVFNLCHYLCTVGPQNLENELADTLTHVDCEVLRLTI